jgi:hypothetical protein
MGIANYIECALVGLDPTWALNLQRQCVKYRHVVAAANGFTGHEAFLEAIGMALYRDGDHVMAVKKDIVQELRIRMLPTGSLNGQRSHYISEENKLVFKTAYITWLETQTVSTPNDGTRDEYLSYLLVEPNATIWGHDGVLQGLVSMTMYRVDIAFWTGPSKGGLLVRHRNMSSESVLLRDGPHVLRVAVPTEIRINLVWKPAKDNTPATWSAVTIPRDMVRPVEDIAWDEIRHGVVAVTFQLPPPLPRSNTFARVSQAAQQRSRERAEERRARQLQSPRNHTSRRAVPITGQSHSTEDPAPPVVEQPVGPRSARRRGALLVAQSQVGTGAASPHAPAPIDSGPRTRKIRM